MARTTVILLPETAYQNPGDGSPYTVTGNARPGSSYYLGTNMDQQTVTVNLHSVKGNVKVDATLVSTPEENDWFNVYSLEADCWAEHDTEQYENSNAKVYTNLIGNFVHLRARVEDFQFGVVNSVKATY